MATELRPERQLPQNLEAEVCLLGSILLDNEAMGDVVSLVDPQSFYSPANQLLYEIFVRCFETKKPLDAVILHDELARRDALARVGGPEYIAQVMEAVPSPANAEYYARIVREAAVKRKLLATVSLIEREIYHPTMETDELLEMSERAIFEVVQRKGDRRDLQIGEILKQAIKKIADIHDRRARLSGLSTGFYDLDNALGGGMHPSQLIIIAGRPGMGKTSFVMRIAEHVGLQEKKGVLFFSLEMDQANIAQNMLCAHARISSWNIRKGLISTEDIQRLLLAAGAFYEAPIYLDDSTSLSVLEIRARARRFKAEKDIGLVVIDYLQLMEQKNAESRQQEIAIISRSLKHLARELQVPVIALSQLSRAVEGRDDRRPRLSDLRESGAIEQDADVVLMLYRDEVYNEKTTPAPGVCEAIIAKNRSGPTDTVNFAFLKEYMRFENLAARREGQ